jgi:hypothetical protein
MKSIPFGLLSLNESIQTNSFIQDSLVASNRQHVVDVEADAITGVGDRASAAFMGLDGAFDGGDGIAVPTAGGALKALSESRAVDRPRYQPAASEHDHAHEGDDHDHDHDHEGHDHDHEGHDHDHSDGICAELLSEGAWLAAQGSTEQTLSGDSSVVLGAALMSLNQTFRLHSNPGAKKVIYLDFDGHTTSGTSWNSWNNGAMGASFYSPSYDIDGNAANLSDNEKVMIQNIWQRVAADFAAFDVDVTTQAPTSDWLIKSDSSDVNYGMRVVVTGYGPSSGSAGGIAYIDSFNANSDTPCFVYNTSVLGVSEAISHEVGHTLGLSHDGTFDGSTTVGYYTGNSTELDPNGWAPIMGLGYYRNMTTWDNGVYYQSNNTGSTANYGKGADDLAVITGFNGFSYAQDLESDLRQEAAALNIRNGMVGQFGTIQTAVDVDWFRFDILEASDVNLSFEEAIYRAFVDTDDLWGGSFDSHYASVYDTNGTNGWNDHATNLNLGSTLYTSSGDVYGQFGARMRISGLAAGSYCLRLDGLGYGDPTLATGVGYTDYASIGDYLISGTIAASSAPISVPVITLALPVSSVMEDGSDNLMFTFTRSVVTADPLTVNFQVAGNAGNGVDYSGLMPVVSQSVTFAANAATATVLVDPTADGVVEANETVSLQLAFGSGYTIGTTSAVVGTILNDDLVSSTPAISLALSSSSVSEDGSSNLLFTFTRSVVTASALSVNYSVAGTASNGTDYSGLQVGSTQTVTFAANAATATVVIDPTADNSVEADETVSLTLQAGTGYTLGTSQAVSGTISNDDPNSMLLTFSGAVDSLTGSSMADSFKLNQRADALWSSTPDRIIGLQAGVDSIDSPFSRTSAITPKLMGSVKTLDAAGIGALLTSKAFARNGAATFSFGAGSELRTFLALNDGTSGFNASNDSVLEITGFSGNLSALSIF